MLFPSFCDIYVGFFHIMAKFKDCLLFAVVLTVTAFQVEAATKQFVTSPVVVRTKLGPIRGHVVGDNDDGQENANANNPVKVLEFASVPFAEPPINELRYKKPVSKRPWQDELDATRQPDVCPQLVMTGMFNNFEGFSRLFPKGNQSEDCLYLNIWVPKAALEPPKKKLAVLVFIHGGGFSAGGSTEDVSNGTILAAYNNIIVVSIQYRLGSLGFGYYGKEDLPGNMGLWDQLEALKWVHENINAFGGDPDEVTIAGESAGGASVTYHLLSPYSRPYFKRAIVESGTALCPWALRTPEVAVKLTDMVYQQVSAQHCNNLPDQPSVGEKIACLKSIDPAVFPIADFYPSLAGYGSFIFVPAIDGDFLPRHPYDMLKNGEFNKVPLLIGANKDEGSMFLMAASPAPELLTMPNSPSENPLMNELNMTHYNALVGASVKMGLPSGPEPAHPLLAAAVQMQYWSSGKDQLHSGNGYPTGDNAVKAAVAASSDAIITCPVYNWAQLSKPSSKEKIFSYFFTHRHAAHVWPKWMGVMHSDEMAYVFGEPFAAHAKQYGYTDDEKKFSRILMAYWTNFVKFGDPNIQDVDTYNSAKGPLNMRTWPAYSGDEKCQQATLELDTLVQVHNEGKGVECKLKTRECLFWTDFFPKLANALTKGHSDTCQDGHCFSKYNTN